MAEYTNKLNLYKPNRADEVEVDASLSENFQKIDDQVVKTIQGSGQTIQTGSQTIPNTSTTGINVTFPEAFNSVPFIFLSLRSLSGQYKDYYVTNETTTGFTIAFNTPFADTSGRRFWWMAIGN